MNRILFWIGSATLLVCGSFLFAGQAVADSSTANNDQRLVTIHDNGKEQTIVTKESTVKGALRQAGITLGRADIVEPATTDKLVAKSYQINIFRARPVVVVEGLRSIRVLTAEQSPRKIAQTAGLSLYDEDVTTLERVDNVLSGGGAGLRLNIDKAIVFNLTLFGKRFEARSQANTVGELLKEKGIVLGVADGVMPAQKTPLTTGLEVRIWRDGKQTITQEEVVAKPVEEIKSMDYDRSYRKLKTAGADGKRNVTYEVETRDGVEISRREIASVTVLEPVKEVVVVGAKVLGAYTTPSENEKITWEFLIAQGFTREQTAGIMGNLMQEHGFNTSGDGLAQWTGGRKLALMSLPDPYNIHTQLQFLMIELNGPYARVRDAIKSSSTIDQSVIIFQNQFERCGVCAESKRIQYAYNIFASH